MSVFVCVLLIVCLCVCVCVFVCQGNCVILVYFRDDDLLAAYVRMITQSGVTWSDLLQTVCTVVLIVDLVLIFCICFRKMSGGEEGSSSYK